MPTSYKIPTGDTSKQLDGVGKINRNTGLTVPPAPVEPIAIPISSLSTSQTPITVPPIAPATQSLGLNNQLGTQADTFIADAEKSADRAATNKNSSLDALAKAIQDNKGEAQLESELYAQEGGVNDTAKVVREVNAQILAEKEALLSQEEELRKNPQGLFGGALEDKIQELRDDSLRRTTRLSIQSYVANQNYQGAREIADRAVAALTEKQQNKIDVLGLIYGDNKDDFNEKERRAFEVAQEARTRALDDERFKIRAQFEQQIKQSDPLYKAQLAKIYSEIDAGNVTITNPVAGRFTGALSTILGSGKFTKDQKASLIAAVNEGEDPFTVIKNQAKTILGQAGDTKLTAYETAQTALQDVEAQLKAYYAAGGDTGIFKGNYENVINKLGSVSDERLVEIGTQIQASLQVYRNAVSGTAYSVQEGQDIASIFPGINKNEGLNQAILNGRMAAFQSSIDGTYRTALGSSYDELKRADEVGVKGQTSDKDFVEQVLVSRGMRYDDVVAKTPSGQKAVIDNKTGKVGYIPQYEFDAKRYTSL